MTRGGESMAHEDSCRGRRGVRGPFVRAGRGMLLAALAHVAVMAARARAVEVVVDCSKAAGTIRALHGVNNGPLDGGGLVDLSARHKELAVPFTRLHDAHWPNPDVVDVHVVFPD